MIEVLYPKAEWKPIDELANLRSASIGPSGVDLWIFNTKFSSVCRYINWSGFKSDIRKLKEDGYTHWTIVEKPDIPKI